MNRYVSPANLLLAAAIYVLVTALKQALPGLTTTRLGRRVLPILPVILGVLGALAGFVDSAIDRLPDRIAVGVLSGAFSAWGFKFVQKTVRGVVAGDPEANDGLPPSKTGGA